MKKNKQELKTYFERGDKPTEEQFSDLIDSYVDAKQLEGEANRRFVIDKSGEVLVDSEQAIPEYTLSDISGNKLGLLKDGVIVKEIDLTAYVDDTNLARLVSGTVDVDGIATFKRDDNSAFTVDFGRLFDNVVKPTGLELVTGFEGSGWALIGRDTDNYGLIGSNAIDLSVSNIANFNKGATGEFSFVSGFNTQANGDYSHAEGNTTVASGDYSHAEGNATIASGKYSHAENARTKAIGDYSHAEGLHTEANGTCSHAEGTYTEANGNYSHAEGVRTKAIGDYSHAEGYGAEAKGSHSHAEGNYTQANGDYSHAEGSGAEASGIYSHAEGYGTEASGQNSHAEGSETKAEGKNSHSSGFKTTASSYSEAVFGSYNTNYTPNSKTNFNLNDRLFVIGNGTAPTKLSDALIVSKNGKITAPSFDIDKISGAKDLITKEYADTNYVSNIGLITEGEGSFTPTISPINGVDYSGNITGTYNYIGNRVDFVVKLENIKGGLDSSTQDVVINIPIGVSEPINGKYIGDVEKSKVIIEEFSGWNVNFFSVNPYMTSVGGLVTFLRLKTSSNSSLYDTNLKGVSVTNAKMVLKGSFYLSENIL